jgi:DNA-binding NarL/FixJ family response regulator
MTSTRAPEYSPFQAMAGAHGIRVLVTDDHAVVRTGIRRALEPHRDIEVVGEATDGATLLAHPALAVADVVTLDMNLPDTDVLRLIPECRARAPRARVLVFTMQPEDAYAVAALRAGAVGFLSKDRSMEELVEAVRRVGRGETHVSRALADKLIETPDVTSALPHATLSGRERQIFDRIVRGRQPERHRGRARHRPVHRRDVSPAHSREGRRAHHEISHAVFMPHSYSLSAQGARIVQLFFEFF